jgi:hypothetical protein
METGFLRGREAVVASIGGFISSFDDYWCEEPEELIDAGNWVIVVVRSGGRGRASGVPVSQVWTVACKLQRGRIIRIDDREDDKALTEEVAAKSSDALRAELGIEEKSAECSGSRASSADAWPTPKARRLRGRLRAWGISQDERTSLRASSRDARFGFQ